VAIDRALPFTLNLFPDKTMCRNIKQLYNFNPSANDDEINAAAIQYVRKISGFAKPSGVNEQAFNRAVAEIAKISKTLLESLTTNAPVKDREVEQARTKERNGRRFVV
jgi:hypothetical protein